MDEINKEETLKILEREEIGVQRKKKTQIKFWLNLFESKNFIIISGEGSFCE